MHLSFTAPRAMLSPLAIDDPSCQDGARRACRSQSVSAVHSTARASRTGRRTGMS